MTNVAQTVSLLSQMGVFNEDLIREFVEAANSSAALHSAATQAKHETHSTQALHHVLETCRA